MPVDRVGAGDRQQLSTTFVQLDVQAKERLQASAEAAASAPHAFRDRAHPPAMGGVEVQDAIGLAVAHRAQDHRLGLDCSTPHATILTYPPDDPGSLFSLRSEQEGRPGP